MEHAIPEALLVEVRQAIFEDVGISVPADVLAHLHDSFQVVDTLAVPSRFLGPFAPAIEDMYVTVKIGAYCRDCKMKVVVEYEYDYNHTSGGHNGCTARREFEEK
jgi:hypothetical protein